MIDPGTLSGIKNPHLAALVSPAQSLPCPTAGATKVSSGLLMSCFIPDFGCSLLQLSCWQLLIFHYLTFLLTVVSIYALFSRLQHCSLR